ncbi:MAG: transglutaminase domain-containing protein [Lachnospiraceae bacterium]|nr:transglutaminase domain-containing protein [Lachnospiraceae bacterium]
MKFYKVLSTLLTATVVFTGCAGSAMIKTQPNEFDVQIKGEDYFSESVQASCDTKGEISDEENSEDVLSEESVSDYYSFEPHVYSGKLSEIRDDSYWSSLYNLIDAIRSGEDTFECCDKETYHLLLDGITMNHLYPIACMFITEYSGDDKPAYENGIGRIEYAISKEEFEDRRIKFEEDIEEILRQTVRTDYSDFEKCMALYEYMCYNFTYEYDEDPMRDNEGSTYHTIKERTGICCELGSAYAYLLLQCGVDALEIQSNDDIYHAWTYVTINGEGYHCDPTWGLTEKDDPIRLWYFMETEQARTNEGFDMTTLDVPLYLDVNLHFPENISFPADDDKFLLAWSSTYDSIDRENNILYCTDYYSNEKYEIPYDM